MDIETDDVGGDGHVFGGDGHQAYESITGESWGGERPAAVDHYDYVLRFIRGIDPSILSIQIISADPETQKWIVRTWDDSSHEGMIEGTGLQVDRFTGGAKYDLTSKEEAIRKMQADPEFETDLWLTSRE
jgi:hypothetical protein